MHRWISGKESFRINPVHSLDLRRRVVNECRVPRNFISPSPEAWPARILKKSAAVSTPPTFCATAAAIHWFNDTPSSFASRCAAFLIESGSFNG